MPLKEQFEANGNWLFVRRSWLPVTLYPFAIIILYYNIDKVYTDLLNPYWSLFCLIISILGLLIRVITVGYTPQGTSGRNTRGGQVAEALNQSGIYSIVRHPLYLGNFLMWLGLFLYLSLWWFVVICSLIYWLYYERIMIAEEGFLTKKYGKAYEDWAFTTPAFIPDLSLYYSANLSFSFKNVLKREYNGLFAVAISFALFNSTAHYFYNQTFYIDFFWQVVVLLCFVIFIILRTLKKYTKMLDVKGR